MITAKTRRATLLPLAFALAIMLLGPPVLAQVERPDAAVAPIGAIGDISEGQQGIIFNRLLSQLSDSYQLVSQDEFARAEEKAFEELEDKQCTAEQCIRKIQDILQIDRLFVLQVIKEGDFVQLSLTLARADDKIVKAADCTDCGIAELNQKIFGLVSSVIAADRGGAGAVTALAAAPAQADPLSSWRMKWLSTAGGAVVAALYMYTESQSLTDANARQDELAANADGTTSLTEYESLTAQMDSEKSAAEGHQQNAETGLYLTVILTGLAAWIYLDPPQDSTAAAFEILPVANRRGGMDIAFRTRW